MECDKDHVTPLMASSPCYSEWETRARPPFAPDEDSFPTILSSLSLLWGNYMLWKFQFHCRLPLISPHRATASREWEWGLARPLGCVCTDLQGSLLASAPSKHDPLLSQAIPPSPHWWVSELLKFPSPVALRRWPGLCLALLWIAQGHCRGREGGRKRIYQDVLLYFFYPSPRRWFYFSENPLNSDQVRWLLSLETQELSAHNLYKCLTPRWGTLGQGGVSGDLFGPSCF